MFAVQLNELDRLEVWQDRESTPRWSACFPFAGKSEIESLGCVYFELEPGEELPTHTDSQDEVVVLLSGSGEGTVGDKTASLAASGMVFIPAMVPHGFRNTGSETVRALGVFAGAAVTSTFDHDIMPIGMRVFKLHEAPA